METVHLIGSEEVGRAGRQMAEAAHTIQQAANLISESLTNHQRFFDDWLERFRNTLEDHRQSLENGAS